MRIGPTNKSAGAAVGVFCGRFESMWSGVGWMVFGWWGGMVVGWWWVVGGGQVRRGTAAAVWLACLTLDNAGEERAVVHATRAWRRLRGTSLSSTSPALSSRQSHRSQVRCCGARAGGGEGGEGAGTGGGAVPNAA